MRSVRFDENVGLATEPMTISWSTFANSTCSRGSCEEAMRGR